MPGGVCSTTRTPKFPPVGISAPASPPREFLCFRLMPSAFRWAHPSPILRTVVSTMEIADIAQFGFAGFLALLAWRFWEKSPRLALTFLVAAGAGGILLMILEVRNASNPYDVKLLPPPSPSWAAVHDGGAQIPVVSAQLIRGDTVEREVTMESVPVADRQLSASLDPADPSRILVQSGPHLQGYVLVNNLQGDLRNAIFQGSTSHIPSRRARKSTLSASQSMFTGRARSRAFSTT